MSEPIGVMEEMKPLITALAVIRDAATNGLPVSISAAAVRQLAPYIAELREHRENGWARQNESYEWGKAKAAESDALRAELERVRGDADDLREAIVAIVNAGCRVSDVKWGPKTAQLVPIALIDSAAALSSADVGTTGDSHE